MSQQTKIPVPYTYHTNIIPYQINQSQQISQFTQQIPQCQIITLPQRPQLNQQIQLANYINILPLCQQTTQPYASQHQFTQYINLLPTIQPLYQQTTQTYASQQQFTKCINLLPTTIQQYQTINTLTQTTEQQYQHCPPAASKHPTLKLKEPDINVSQLPYPKEPKVDKKQFDDILIEDHFPEHTKVVKVCFIFLIEINV